LIVFYRIQGAVKELNVRLEVFDFTVRPANIQNLTAGLFAKGRKEQSAGAASQTGHDGRPPSPDGIAALRAPLLRGADDPGQFVHFGTG